MFDFENSERDFKGVWIDKEIWLNKDLSALDKVVFTEIASLDNGDKHCWASNKYLAEFCQVSESTIIRSINKLEKLGYIEKEIQDNYKRTIRVCQNGIGVFQNDRGVCQIATQIIYIII